MKVLSVVHHYNFVMVERRKSLGLTQIELAQYIGCPITKLQNIERLRNVAHHADIMNTLENIADFLEIPFDEIFPPDYLQAMFGKTLLSRDRLMFLNESSLETLPPGQTITNLLPAGVDNLSNQDPSSFLEEEELIKAVRTAIEHLPAREQKILELRFGLKGDEPLTLEETAKKFNLSRDRIRQIESVALSRLRNAKIRRKLEDHIVRRYS